MGAADTPVSVDVLGPLRLVVDGAAVDVPGPKRRAVLALLALAGGRTVTVDHLADTLWPDDSRDAGRQALHTHISRLRAHLGPAASRLQTSHAGYRLDLGRNGLDVKRARDLLASARAIKVQDPASAVARLRKALDLWRGPVMADLTDVPQIGAAAEDCANLKRDITQELIDSAIAADQADQVTGLAAGEVAADPLHEPAVRLLMRTLAACGRAAEALSAGREYRHRLAEETGLDPSQVFRDLEHDVAAGAAGPPPNRQAVPAWPTTRIIGRETQVASLHRLLATERLVTLVGPGGVGKTRLAMEVARQSETVWVLSLAPVTDGGAIAHALAAALNLKVVQGDVLTACTAILADRPGVLVVDNCEHVLEQVRDMVQAILSNCPDLVVLATSRERLGLAAEHVFRLAPLTLPGTDTGLSSVPSVALFLDRAARVYPGRQEGTDLQVVADIVRHLDGIPLAIELAAGRLSAFSPTDLRDRLGRSLDLLSGARSSADARHRTLRATMDWSYQLLDADERRLFRYLSVFPDGVQLDTAEHLATELGVSDDPAAVLAGLVDASMLEARIDGSTRYRMLEPVRAFGLDRLADAGEVDDAAARLIRWAVELTAWISTTSRTEREPEADAVLRRELPNLRAAWRLTRDRGLLDDAVAMVIGLFPAITYRDLVEIRRWAEELAGDEHIATHPRAAVVLGTAAEAKYQDGDYVRAEQLALAGLQRATDADGSWHCLLTLSIAALARSNYDVAIELSEAAAAQARQPEESLGIAALAAAYTGHHEQARGFHQRVSAAASSPTLRSWSAYVAGEIESSAGNSDLAEQHYLRAIELAQTSGATFLAGISTVGLHAERARTGRHTAALQGYREVIDYFARTGNWTHLWVALRNLADLLRHLGDDEPAVLLETAADNAPDAPVVYRPDGAGRTTPGALSAPGRAAVLKLARQAIDRHLSAPVR